MRDLLIQVGGSDDPRDAGVERELEDDTPHGRRRALHGVHEARGSFVQQETEEQKGEVDDVEVDRVQRFAGLHEVADQIRAADENNQPVEDRGMFEPLARSRFHDWQPAVRSPIFRERCRDRAPFCRARRAA